MADATGGNSRKRQAEQTRGKLMDAIVELMDSASYHEISIERICMKAGVSKGTFYHYFKSKREILTHLAQNANDRLLFGLTFDETQSARALFDAYVAAIVRQTYEVCYAGQARMLVAMLTAGASEVYETIKPQTDYVERILRHGQARGEIPACVDVTALNRLITASIQGFVTMWSISHGEIDLKAELAFAFSPIWQLMNEA